MVLQGIKMGWLKLKLMWRRRTGSKKECFGQASIVIVRQQLTTPQVVGPSGVCYAESVYPYDTSLVLFVTGKRDFAETTFQICRATVPEQIANH